MKTVVAIHGGKRKKNTYGVVRQIEKLLCKYGVVVEHIHLHNHNIEWCRGCAACIFGHPCPINDDTAALVTQMHNAAGIIFTSPVYVYTITGVLKNFLDRTVELMHRPILTGKPALIVSTTKGNGLDGVERLLHKSIMTYGMQPTGFIGRDRRNMHKPVRLNEVALFRDYVLGHPADYRPSLQQVFMFNVQKLIAIRYLPQDREYWREKGWLDQGFYWPCKVRPLYLIAGWAFFRMLSLRKAMPEFDRAEDNLLMRDYPDGVIPSIRDFHPRRT